jgi:anti-anti-sigma factor
MTIIDRSLGPDVGVIVVDDERLPDDVLADLYKEIVAHLEASSKKHLMLDLRLLQTFTSPCLGMLIRVRQTCLDRGVMLHLCDLTPTAREVIDNTKLCEIFHIHPDVTAGLRSIGVAHEPAPWSEPRSATGIETAHCIRRGE